MIVIHAHSFHAKNACAKNIYRTPEQKMSQQPLPKMLWQQHKNHNVWFNAAL